MMIDPWLLARVPGCREGTGEETGGEIWDPLDISGSVGDEALMWFRASELKHGRVAMLATVGYLTGAAGITFPGEIAGGVSFASVNANGVFSAWSNVPEAGKLQILSLIFLLELSSESKKPHYMRGGVPGKIDSLPFDGIQGIWAPKIKFWVRGPRFMTRASPCQLCLPLSAVPTPLVRALSYSGPARLHGRADGGAEGEEAQGRAEERSPRNDWHHFVPGGPQPARSRPRAELAVLDHSCDVTRSARRTCVGCRICGDGRSRRTRLPVAAARQLQPSRQGPNRGPRRG